MSISTAFHASRSALSVTATRAEQTSSNIANAGREGYVRREAALTSTRDGFGVAVSAIRRDVNSALQLRERDAAADAALNSATAEGLRLYTQALGEPGDGTTLPDRIADLQTQFDLLSTDPADTNAQRSALRSAEAVARGLTTAAAEIAIARQTAETAAATDIAEANTLLGDIDRFNIAIAAEPGGTVNAAGLLDSRDAAIDRLSEIMDIKTRVAGDGAVHLRVAGGAALLDATGVQELSFAKDTGTLSAGGVDITPGRPGVRGISGGSLAAQITLRNDTLPEMGAQLDSLAAGLVSAFEAADASLAPGQAGLFTDDGAAFDPAAQEGLAARIAVNDALRPDAGGDPARLRDGLGAAVAGPASDPTQVLAFVAALEAPRGFDAEAGLGSDMTLGAYAAALVADQAGRMTRAEAEAETGAATVAAIAMERSSSEGVNIDDELQKLLAIEQSYAANSQVISALTRMMDTLLAAV